MGVQRSRSPFAAKHAQRPQGRRLPAFDKPFFATSLIAYVLGLGATIGAMQWSKAAQPALLYIRYVQPPSLCISFSRTCYFPALTIHRHLPFRVVRGLSCDSPACLVATVLTAYFKGTRAAMCAWVDESIHGGLEDGQGHEKPRDVANGQPAK